MLLFLYANGGWSQWTAWSDCTRTCGVDGIQNRMRNCTKPIPQYEGLECKGQDRRVCKTVEKCRGNFIYAHPYAYIFNLFNLESAIQKLELKRKIEFPQGAIISPSIILTFTVIMVVFKKLMLDNQFLQNWSV